jgi:hypothetical protein
MIIHLELIIFGGLKIEVLSINRSQYLDIDWTN